MVELLAPIADDRRSAVDLNVLHFHLHFCAFNILQFCLLDESSYLRLFMRIHGVDFKTLHWWNCTIFEVRKKKVSSNILNFSACCAIFSNIHQREIGHKILFQIIFVYRLTVSLAVVRILSKSSHVLMYNMRLIASNSIKI